jgi:periplasmic protein TonB
METKPVEYQTWDDLVFENRNKAYGAYALRKAYSNQVLLGFGLSVALLAILLLLPKGMKPEGLPIPKLPVIELKEVPIIERNIPQQRAPQRPPQRAVEQHANVAPVITTDPIETTTSEPTQYVEPVSEESGTSQGVEYVEGTGTAVAPTVVETPKEFVRAEIMPSYIGGDKALYDFISKKMRYPASARRMGIEGTVFVSFLVTGDGTVADVKVIRGIHSECDKEAARVIGMLTGWIGAKQGGYPVSVRMVLPIKFQLR